MKIWGYIGVGVLVILLGVMQQEPLQLLLVERPLPNQEVGTPANQVDVPEVLPEISKSAAAKVQPGEDTSSPSPSPTALVSLETAQVVRVVDGDTIVIDRGQGAESLRYLGVDTPETVHPSRPTGCFGTEASVYNQSLVAGQTVRLERDISDVDKYGRLLRYVYVGDVMINLALVQGGYAQVVTYPPDVRHIEIFRTAETAAREAGRGLWGSVCDGEYTPRLDAVRNSGQAPLDASCVIKGNISQTSGEKIYHVPGCEYYEQTRINEVTGEEWFCSEDEALAAGWRKALNCPL